MPPRNRPRGLTESDYAALAEVRYVIRRFLIFSEGAARDAGVEPQQHQLLLALKGQRGSGPSTIGVVAERLQIRHHSAVELVGRSVKSGLVRRLPSARDGREVTLGITARGQRLLAKLSLSHRDELRSAAPALVRALQAIIAGRPNEAFEVGP
jgi:DNA-binding MarR family transcriptional regulator